MPWISNKTSIHLVLDNAGGHGTSSANGEYTRHLRNEHNIIIKFQPVFSPEVNALDLGIRMSLQTVVEHRHNKRRHGIDAIARAVQEAWADLPADTTQQVFD
jgi:hypothetical protein